MTDDFTPKKASAAAWFRSLRDRIVAAFEELEVRATPAGETPVTFEVTPTSRAEDGGGGIMSVLRGGRVFEKVGVNWSEVHGALGARAQKAMAARGVPGMETDPRFWASGISLVVNASVPANNLKEFLAYAKSKAGTLTYGSAGGGTSSQLSGELFNLITGAKLVHVPYKGAGFALTGVVSGEVTRIVLPIPLPCATQ
jgi:coproporphyrinogen III oxidase